MNKVRAWMLMVTTWGYTWLTVSLVLLTLGWQGGALLAAEGAYVAFAVTIASGVAAVVVVLARQLVDRRIERASAAFDQPQP